MLYSKIMAFQTNGTGTEKYIGDYTIGSSLSYFYTLQFWLGQANLDLSFCIQPLTQLHADGQSLYSLLANTIYSRQIYGATAIKNGCVIA